MRRIFKSKERQEGWYLQRNYPHFDKPLSFENAKKYVENPENIRGHQFYPLLSYKKEERRYRGHGEVKTKSRPIKFSAHLDGYIYSYYSFLISNGYEEKLKNLNLSDHVTAYRRGRGLTNIDFAQQSFEEIKRRKNCVAIALDISGFFDSIDHKNLEVEWCRIFGHSSLPKDHLAVFKSVTKYSEIDKESCYKRLKIIDPKKVPRPLCSNAREFRDMIKGKKTGEESLIKTNKLKFGIPQGTPMSAILSNVYMLPFDEAMRTIEVETGGYYRRYSDDILWICDEKYVDKVIAMVDSCLAERGGENLKRHDKKTEKSSFEMKDKKLVCDKPFQYLGFTFDGRNGLLRSQTLARYWRRLIYSVRGAKKRAYKAKRNGKSFQVFHKKLNHSLTHLGKGNFITSYAYRAQEKMGGKGIRRQLVGHQKRIYAELSKKKES